VPSLTSSTWLKESKPSDLPRLPCQSQLQTSAFWQGRATSIPNPILIPEKTPLFASLVKRLHATCTFISLYCSCVDECTKSSSGTSSSPSAKENLSGKRWTSQRILAEGFSVREFNSIEGEAMNNKWKGECNLAMVTFPVYCFNSYKRGSYCSQRNTFTHWRLLISVKLFSRIFTSLWCHSNGLNF